MSAIEKVALGIAVKTEKFTLTPLGKNVEWSANDAPIFIVMGQSNSYGHGTSLSTNERITTPFTNVFSLNRNTVYKVNVEISDIIWEGLTTLNQHNIATNTGDNTVSAAKEFGRLWQNHISAGNTFQLPNLYVIEAGWGAQGMNLGSGNDRWSPDRDSTSVESLYWRITKTVRCAIQKLKSEGKNPRIIGVHWNQWETEAWSGGGVGSDLFARNNFERIIQGFNDSLGCNAPWSLFYPHSLSYGAYTEGEKPLNVRKSVLNTVASDVVYRKIIDPQLSPFWTSVSPNFGIFVTDNVHYSENVQKWFAQIEFESVINGNRGVVAGTWVQGSNGISDLIERIGTGGGVTENEMNTAILAVETQVSWKANQYNVGDLNVTKPLSATAFSRVGTAQKWSVVNETTSGLKVFRPSDSSGGNKQSVIVFSKSPTDAKYGTVRFVALGRVPIGVAFRLSPNNVNSFQGLGYGYTSLSFYDYVNEGIGIGKVYLWKLKTSPAGGVFGAFQSGGYNGASTTSYTPSTTEWREWEFSLLPTNGGTASIRYREVGGTIWTTIWSESGFDAPLTAAGLSEGQIGIVVGLGIGDTYSGEPASQISRWATSYGSLSIKEFEFISAD